ncbi:hypothetical protein HDV05_005450 [Chytridiales sp. JEL 0842]|nr:hypothetical protein HDV05_005450 [Chytridiales sp. JEL 0842]
MTLTDNCDSFSDNGNVYRLTRNSIPPSPPYWEGRFSNGPVWVEALATALKSTPSNYAFGGAVANRSDLVGGGAIIPDLNTQIGLFEGVIQKNKQESTTTLYTLYAGGNDLIEDLKARQPLNGTAAATAVLNAVTRLLGPPFNAQNILVLNQGSYETLPRVLADMRNAGPQDRIPEIRQFPIDANRLLRSGLDKFTKEKQDVTIYQGDLNKITAFVNTAEGQRQYGFTNVNGSCLGTGGVVCANPDEYLLFDGLHPTTKAHKVVGEIMAGLVTEVSVEYSVNGRDYASNRKNGGGAGGSPQSGGKSAGAKVGLGLVPAVLVSVCSLGWMMVV